MSLLDSILGSLTGGGQNQNPGQGQAGSPIASILGGLLGGGNQAGSPIASILGGLLGGGSQAGQPGAQAGGQASSQAGGMGGGLGALAGMMGGGGLQGLLSQFQNAGLGQVAQSWIGGGANQSISPDQVRNVFGNQQIEQMSQQSGMPQQDLLSQLAHHLPSVVDRMTPNGHMPDSEPNSVSV